MASQPTIRFAAIGLNHNHILGQVNLLLRAGAEFVAYYAPEVELARLMPSEHRFLPKARWLTPGCLMFLVRLK